MIADLDDEMKRRLRALCILPVIAATLIAAYGLAAHLVHASGGYAMRYGTPVTVPLPATCRGNSASEGATCEDEWSEGSDGRSAPFGDGEMFTVHFSGEGWAQYSDYYGGYTERGSDRDPTNVTIEGRAVGNDVFAETGYRAYFFTPLGRERLPRQLWEALPYSLMPTTGILLFAFMRRFFAFAGTRVRDEVKYGKYRVASRCAIPDSPRFSKYLQLRGVVADVSSGTMQVVVNSSGIVFRDSRPAWVRFDLKWDEITEMQIDARPDGRYGRGQTLCVYRANQSTPYQFRTSKLHPSDWEKVARAVSKNTKGRLKIDTPAIA